jgi:hypothetical protein
MLQVKWLIDYDSTIVDLCAAQFDLVEREFGVRYTHDHILAWDWDTWMPPEQSALVWGDRGFKSLDFQASLPAVPGALETIAALREATDDEFVVVSDRPDFLYDVTRDWLDRHGLAPARLIFTDRKTYPKAQCALAEGLTFVVEDAPHHGGDLARCDHIEHVYLLDYAYNRGIDLHDKLLRVPGWPAVLAHQAEVLGRIDRTKRNAA